jgi:hypothetical protein
VKTGSGRRRHRSSKQNDGERAWIAAHQSEHNEEKSRSFQFFAEKYPGTIPKQVLASIGRILAHNLNIEIDRIIYRHKWALFWWLDCHWDLVAPILPTFVMKEVGEDGPPKSIYK